jgi:hypothetical protein
MIYYISHSCIRNLLEKSTGLEFNDYKELVKFLMNELIHPHDRITVYEQLISRVRPR